MSDAARLVQTIWNFCHTLRDDGVSYLDYLEQLTFLLFLKIIDETEGEAQIPASYSWSKLSSLKGNALEAQYFATLHELGREPGVLGAIFDRAQNKVQDPAKLARLIKLIDAQSWLDLDTDTKGDIYEGLLQRNAEDTKSGAGQYFTPRPLIQAIIACIRPQPFRTICDPACGTGGFFLASTDWLQGEAAWLRENQWLGRDSNPLTMSEKAFLRAETFHGNEIVASTRRLCLMNLFLRGIGGLGTEPLVQPGDALASPPSRRFDYVLANPPFGTRSSMTANTDGQDDDDLTYRRPDFWVTTSNKQLNFVQHIAGLLAEGGAAAIVVPDNVLFAAGAGERVRERLLSEFDLHTILRLPTGIFYAQQVRANVLFLERPAGGSGAKTKRGTWVYDLRTNKRFTLKGRPMRLKDLKDFVLQYKPNDRSARVETDRFRFFSRELLLARDRTSLDLNWIAAEDLGAGPILPPPDVLQQAVIEQLEAALEAYREVAATLTRA
ncbi:HsdM family class I SAM-dependent methyltransferase [Aminobacter sp. MET-1]|uniref:class I SAM-dependent DNA methyltransferase n=1 Tax=Aminobacter sp. MET-1 TaxID=2951085 RepID=UPI00226A4B3D|nr:class I SAM-dependent DNA methyltransferase [Aminobacter sp. MET-1]MCX8568790.1 type I restriction-modification system subunit M [Aminobacter sp. MET-1]